MHVPIATIPVVAEEIEVTHRRQRTQVTRVDVVTKTEPREVTLETAREDVEVRRVPVDRFVDEPAQVRVEGDTTIVPVHEEVVVVRLRLREEIHIRKTTRREVSRHEDTVRVQQARITVATPDADSSIPSRATSDSQTADSHSSESQTGKKP